MTTNVVIGIVRVKLCVFKLFVSLLFCVIFTVLFFPVKDHESELNKYIKIIINFNVFQKSDLQIEINYQLP